MICCRKIQIINFVNNSTLEQTKKLRTGSILSVFCYFFCTKYMYKIQNKVANKKKYREKPDNNSLKVVSVHKF